MPQGTEPRIPGRGDDPEAAIAAPDDQTDPSTLPAMRIQAAAAGREHDQPAAEGGAEGEGATADLATAWHTGDTAVEQSE